LLAWSGALFDVGVSTWLDGWRPAHFGGFVTAHVSLRDSSQLSAVVSHDPIWRPSRGTDPLRALRVMDLRQLDRGLTASGFRLATTLGRANVGRTIDLETGATLYSDGNRRAFAAGRVALPIVATPSLEMAIEPNVYAETFSRGTVGFLTPMDYTRAGLGLRFRSHRGLVTLEGFANPHAFRQAGRAGVGMDGVVSSSLALGSLALELSTDFMHQGAYRFVQVAAGLSLRAR
jgi:hypothetical protein